MYNGNRSLDLLPTVVVYNHSFIPKLIGSDWVIDCGANRGDFSCWLSENTRAKVIAYEPDPRLFGLLPERERVTYYNLALAASDGQLSLYLGDELCSSIVHREHSNAKEVKVTAVELSAHLASCEVGTIGLLKLDIEGAELDVLPALTTEFLARVKQITCEFHEFLDPTTLPRVETVIRTLEVHGFYAINFSRHNYGDVLFINRRYLDVGVWQQLTLHVTKYFRGSVRLLRRKGLKFVAQRLHPR